MGNIVNSSLAAGVGVGVQNVQFQPQAEDLPRKQIIIGTYDNTKTGITVDVPALTISPNDTADKYGFGSMLHRLHLKNELGAQGVETWISPQAEAGGATASTGQYDFATSTGVEAGTLALYIAGERVAVNLSGGETVEEITDACVAAINDDQDLPVTASKVAVSFETKIDAKTLGTWGEDIDLSINLRVGDETPTGVVVAITAMSGGAGTPDISTALNGLGTGDNANEANFTALCHGYGQDTTTLDAIRDYVGAGDQLLGLYSETVARPFRSLVGDVTAGSAGLTAVKALGDGRKTDRASGVVPVPGSASHPQEIAAQTIGHAERINKNIAAQSYAETILIGVDPGDSADRWTSEYSDRESAVSSGSGTTLVRSGNVTLQDVVTFYHPDSVPVTSNGYREYVNISKLQNIMNTIKTTFSQAKWQGVIIVDDANLVTSSVDRTKARDTQSVKDDLIALAKSWQGKAWIYQAEFTVDNIEVEVRPATDGFNTIIPLILSGVGKIIDNRVNFDTSIAILL